MPTLRESGDMGLVSRIAALQDKTSFKELHWDGTLEDYLKIVRENPRVTRTAFQRIYDMILSHGKTEYIDNKKRLIRYHFFHDEPNGGRDAVYGLDVPLMKLVNVFKSAAQGYGTEKRVILLHGPVGSSKSTIVRLLKKGLEEYSRTPEGALYTFAWVLEKKREDGTIHREVFNSPMNEDPLLLIPEDWREKVFADLASPDAGFQVPVRADLCPASRLIFRELMTEYKGDFAKVMSLVRVRRLLLSEKDRVGIGTFQPKDEKNQDSTELTGDVNYRKIAEYGSDSDPRAFNFDGEFNIANRGIIEFVEVLKLDVAFLYDLLGASQEHKIKPKKFPQTDIDEVIIGHTNEPEYRKLQNNEFMEALRDRTVKIDIPYITKLTDEIKVYEKDYNAQRIRGKHIAPHTIEMAAMWAVLTRLETPKKANLTLLQKLKLYDGKTLPGYTEDSVKELQKEAAREGMDGISPRYIQDKISNALVNEKYTGQDEDPDERLMRSIEEKIDIPESRKDDFRREIMNYIGALAIEGRQFNYRTNERLYKALELKLFEDRKDSIKLTSLVSNVVDKETQGKIDVVKSRLIKNYTYCDVCATDVLNYVASIFARGDAKE